MLSRLCLLILWLDLEIRVSGPSVFSFNSFDELLAISKEVDEKFRLMAKDKKKASSSLPQWGQVCRFGDEESFHKAPKVNDSFSRLLTKQVSSSRSLFLSLDDSEKLEACIRGQIQS